MKFFFRITSFLLVFLYTSISMAGSYTADMVKTRGGKTHTGKFYLLDHDYRMEMREGDIPVVVITDKEKNLHHVLDMKKREYFDAASDDFKVLSMDPFAASQYMVSKYGSQAEGTETVNSMKCERQTVAVQGKKILSRWVSTEMKFPVKIIMYAGKEEAVTELRKIAETHLEKQMFSVPDNFKQVEDPDTAARRRKKELRTREKNYAGMTTKGKAQVPCYVKIAAAGELSVPVDTNRSVKVEVINQTRDESILTIQPYRKGQKVESIGVSPWKINGVGGHRDREYNKDFWKGSNAFTVDELRIVVEKGLVYVLVTQSGPNRKDLYNHGGLQNGVRTDPKRPLTLRITGDNPFGEKTSGTFRLGYESGGRSDKVSFEVKNNKTVSFDFSADKKVNDIQVMIPAGNGRARLTVLQPPAP